MAKIKNLEVMIGCDPEIFVKQGEQLVSAHNLIPGTKEAPYKVRKGSVQVDGMALEFNIDPAKNFKEFNDNIDSVMETLRDMVPRHQFEIEPVAEFGKKYIELQPEDAKRLGCMPDFNAYTKEPNPIPDASANFRTASGHIHISWKDTTNPKWPNELDPFEPTHFEACCQLVKTLDAYLGIPSIVWDRDPTRSKLYGKAGCFRPKCYGGGWLGLEYRVLSNKWLHPTTDPVKNASVRSCIYNNTIEAITSLLNDYDIADKKWYGNYTAREIVDNKDNPKMLEAAARILSTEVIKSPVYYRNKAA